MSKKETAVLKAVEEGEEVRDGGDKAVGSGDWVVRGGDGNGFGSGLNSGSGLEEIDGFERVEKKAKCRE